MFFNKFKIILIITVAWGGGSTLAESKEIIVSQTSTISGSIIHLKDIVNLRGFSMTDMEMINDITLGESPEPLQPVHISKAKIQSSLLDHKVNMEDVTINGFENVTVIRQFTSVTADDVEDLMKTHIATLQNVASYMIDVLDVSLVEPLLFADKQVEFEVKNVTKEVGDSYSFELLIYNQNKLIHSVTLRASIYLYMPVIQA